MKINLKWLLLTSLILALIIVYYFRPKIIEGHKINNEWHKKQKETVMEYYILIHTLGQLIKIILEELEPVVTSDHDWVSQAYTDGYNCFKDGKETIKEKECRILGINCQETEPDILTVILIQIVMILLTLTQKILKHIQHLTEVSDTYTTPDSEDSKILS